MGGGLRVFWKHVLYFWLTGNFTPIFFLWSTTKHQLASLKRDMLASWKHDREPPCQRVAAHPKTCFLFSLSSPIPIWSLLSLKSTATARKLKTPSLFTTWESLFQNVSGITLTRKTRVHPFVFRDLSICVFVLKALALLPGTVPRTVALLYLVLQYMYYWNVVSQIWHTSTVTQLPSLLLIYTLQYR